jgi:hypothetical protein
MKTMEEWNNGKVPEYWKNGIMVNRKNGILE